jgi:hypothetical protein
MDYASGFMQVFYGTQKLEKIISGESFVKASLLVFDFDKGKQISLLDKFQDDEENLDCFATDFYYKFSLYVVFNQFDYI